MGILSFVALDDKVERLMAAARERDVSLEKLLQQITDDFLTYKDEFQSAAGYVLRKNAELYRRMDAGRIDGMGSGSRQKTG